MGRMKRSNFGGLRVKPSPTYVCFVIMRFHDLRFVLPVVPIEEERKEERRTKKEEREREREREREKTVLMSKRVYKRLNSILEDIGSCKPVTS